MILLNNLYYCDWIDQEAAQFYDVESGERETLARRKAQSHEPCMLSRLPVLASIKASARLQVKRSYTAALVQQSLQDSLLEETTSSSNAEDNRLPALEENDTQPVKKRRKDSADMQKPVYQTKTQAVKRPLQVRSICISHNDILMCIFRVGNCCKR